MLNSGNGAAGSSFISFCMALSGGGSLIAQPCAARGEKDDGHVRQCPVVDPRAESIAPGLPSFLLRRSRYRDYCAFRGACWRVWVRWRVRVRGIGLAPRRGLMGGLATRSAKGSRIPQPATPQRNHCPRDRHRPNCWLTRSWPDPRGA
jgi:hypothetical protein